MPFTRPGPISTNDNNKYYTKPKNNKPNPPASSGPGGTAGPINPNTGEAYIPDRKDNSNNPGGWNAGTIIDAGQDALNNAMPGVGSVVNPIIDAIQDATEGAAEKIHESVAELNAKLQGVVGDYWAETKNAEFIQEDSTNFVTPYKTPEQLQKLHLKQLVETWEEIRLEDGQFHYLLHEAPAGMTSGSGPGSPGFGNTGQYTGTMQEIVWQFYTNNGFSKQATAGIMGNIEQESTFDPDLVEAGSGEGYGLLQWSHSRKPEIIAKAAELGKELSDVHFQLEFSLDELESERQWIANPGYSFAPYGHLYPYSDFKSTTDIDWAVKAICWMYLRPKEGPTANMERRLEAGHRYYNEFKDKVFTAPGAGYSGDATGLAKAIMDECYNYEGLGYTQNTGERPGPTRYGPTHYDCSSLVQKIYLDVAGVDLGPNTYTQVGKHGDASFGIKVPVSQAQPADLFYYFTNGTSEHVSICCGGNRIFHAATEQLGILFQEGSNMTPDYAFRIAPLINNSSNNSGSTGTRRR